MQLQTSERASIVAAEAVPSKQEERSTDDADDDVVHAKQPTRKVAQDRRVAVTVREGMTKAVAAPNEQAGKHGYCRCGALETGREEHG